MCDAGNRGASRGRPDEPGVLGAAAMWLATAAGQALRERLAIQLAADTEGLHMEVDAGGRLMARFQVRTVKFEVAFPHDFPRDQPWMRWRGAVDQRWLPPVQIEPPADAATAEARAFAFLEVTVPRVVAGFAAQKTARVTAGPPASDGAAAALDIPAPPRTARKRRGARRVAVETVIITQAVPGGPEGGSDPGD